MSFSDRPSSVVSLSVRLSVNFSHFRLLLQNRLANFNQTCHKSSLGGEGIQVCSNERKDPSPRGDNSKSVKIYRKFLKIFSRTSRPISIKLGKNHPWVKGIQVCSNKGLEKTMCFDLDLTENTERCSDIAPDLDDASFI